jgi:hypothetical protein
VHRGGIADDDFVSQVKTHPTLKFSKEGQPIAIDGALVAGMVSSTVTLGTDLIVFVNGALKRMKGK